MEEPWFWGLSTINGREKGMKMQSDTTARCMDDMEGVDKHTKLDEHNNVRGEVGIMGRLNFSGDRKHARLQ